MTTLSYDLNVYSHLEPRASVVDEFCNTNGLAAGGSLDGTGSHLVLTRAGEPVVEIDGPLEIETEDLPDVVGPALLAPRWLVEMYVVGPRKADTDLGRKLARALADAAQGVVYDPQDDAVVSPRSARRRPDVDRRTELIRLVELEWCFARRLEAADATRLLALLRRRMTEAVPRRFGTFEPPQHRLDRDGDQTFARAWDGDELFFWNASWPCFGGSVSLRRGTSYYPDEPRLPWCDGLSLNFDGRALHADVRWSDAVADLFVAVAEEFRPFYAAAVVQRNVGCSRNNALWYEAASEAHSPLGRFWLGIPPFGTWLTWFGDPYRDKVEASLPQNGSIQPRRRILGSRREVEDYSLVDRRGPGTFLRLGREPQDVTQLRDWFPALPADLLRRGDHLAHRKRARRIPTFQTPEGQ